MKNKKIFFLGILLVLFASSYLFKVKIVQAQGRIDCSYDCVPEDDCRGRGVFKQGKCPDPNICCDLGGVTLPTEAISEGTIHNPLLKPFLQSSSGNSPLVISTVIHTLISLLFIGASLTFLFILLINGLHWMTAGGDQEKLKEARGKMTSALIGLGIILSVFTIMKLIDSLFGVNLLEFSIPRL